MSKAYRRLHSWTRRLARAELRTNKNSCYVNFQVHRTAVIMPHHPTKTDKAKREELCVLHLICLLMCTRVLNIAGNAGKQVPNIDPLAMVITWYLPSSSEVTVVFNDIQFSDFFLLCPRVHCVKYRSTKNRQNHFSPVLRAVPSQTMIGTL